MSQAPQAINLCGARELEVPSRHRTRTLRNWEVREHVQGGGSRIYANAHVTDRDLADPQWNNELKV
jgi:hypothetical protein